jgi:menaquinone-dependent protoporphyrinogen oxidase
MYELLMIYATTRGHTKAVATMIANVCTDAGIKVTMVNTEDEMHTVTPESYDGVIVAAPVYSKKYLRSIVKWVDEHSDDLSNRPSAFVSVSRGPLMQELLFKEEAIVVLNDFFERTGWVASTVLSVGGATPFTRLGFIRKWLARRVAAKNGSETDTDFDYVYTDWRALEKFVREFIYANFLNHTSRVPRAVSTSWLDL